jgi:hypothetical protein
VLQDSLKNSVVLRIRTHLITENDDVAEIIQRYAGDIAEPGDIVGIAESVVAITQGRALDPDKVRPSLIARLISRFAHPDASISAPRSMQMAIREVGLPRILLAAFAGLLGKITGKKGLFFKVAGHGVAEIDDSGGTMPPYDRSIILGPKEPDAVARKAWRKTGLWTLILDVNDKGCVDILGSSFPVSPCKEKEIQELLKSNPFGNDDQKTPLVVIKPPRRARGGQPAPFLVRAD